MDVYTFLSVVVVDRTRWPDFTAPADFFKQKHMVPFLHGYLDVLIGRHGSALLKLANFEQGTASPRSGDCGTMLFRVVTFA